MESFQRALFLAAKDRFDQKWLKDKHSDCWIWSAAIDTCGYGIIGLNSKTIHAHRMSWMLKNDKVIPDGMCVCHTCDNPPCVNPDHLFLGSHRDNRDDAIRKGRWPKGHKISNHEKQARQLYKLLCSIT